MDQNSGGDMPKPEHEETEGRPYLTPYELLKLENLELRKALEDIIEKICVQKSTLVIRQMGTLYECRTIAEEVLKLNWRGE